MRRKTVWIIRCCLLLALTGCGEKTAEWNGEVEYYARVSMVVDETNLYEYVGVVDYVFVGTVEEVVESVVSGEGSDCSVYRIRVDLNLKGELAESIECSKQGGYKSDGTMLLLFSDRSRDSGLPQEGGQYVFLAYAQSDGSLLLSEFFDNRPYGAELLSEYQDYCENEVPFERKRFVSSFDRSRE